MEGDFNKQLVELGKAALFRGYLKIIVRSLEEAEKEKEKGKKGPETLKFEAFLAEVKRIRGRHDN